MEKIKQHDKAIFLYPENGYPYDQEKCRKYLKLGRSYDIEKIEVEDFETKVWLKKFPKIYFNSVMFHLNGKYQRFGGHEKNN